MLIAYCVNCKKFVIGESGNDTDVTGYYCQKCKAPVGMISHTTEEAQASVDFANAFLVDL